MMTCKRAEKLVPQFLNDELDIEDLREFIGHIKTCEQCREELTIEFLVKEGLLRLENGAVFDLNRELGLRMAAAEHKLKVRENLKLIYYTVSGLVGAEVIAAALLFFFLYLK